MEFFLQPWPWYVAGPLITLVMFLLFYFGKTFGVSSNLETICAIGGAGKFNSYFKLDWRKNTWNLIFVFGAIIGGFISYQWLTPNEVIALNPQTIQDLSEIGIKNAGQSYLPAEIFSLDALFSLKGILVLLLGGFLVGFGTRYAGGCTSGHAIVGLSNLEIPSLIAVIGFFVGGLIMTWVFIPIIF
ncbi:YeeE/YedE family protein [Aureibaculum sp. A20]|uniref:YeeE/YedE family protein n=1 Tax=Aureibaculum flavum TaxID=2795986 RepID=A0ABS0WQP4_9FLAO|nr:MULTISPECIES: YeeE/YedE thiosulfate transporter family protein [Aureibaculum]MBJ2174295.1 YeeE/YedE family protein [Aureibaculum flavum]